MIMKWLNLKWIAKHVPHSFRSPTSSPIYHTHSTTVNFLHSTVHIDSLITVCCHSTLYAVCNTASTRIASAHLSFRVITAMFFIIPKFPVNTCSIKANYPAIAIAFCLYCYDLLFIRDYNKEQFDKFCPLKSVFYLWHVFAQFYDKLS